MHIEAYVRDFKISFEPDKEGNRKWIVARLDIENTEANRQALARMSSATVRVEPMQLPLPEAANA